MSFRSPPPLRRCPLPRVTVDLGSHASRWDPRHTNEGRERQEVFRCVSLISTTNVQSFICRRVRCFQSRWFSQTNASKKKKETNLNMIDSVFAGSFARILDLCNQNQNSICFVSLGLFEKKQLRLSIYFSLSLLSSLFTGRLCHDHGLSALFFPGVLLLGPH